MKGYVARKGNRWYAVIYEGSTRSPGGNDGVAFRRHQRADAERLAARLAANTRSQRRVRSLTFGVFLTTRWLPGKRLVLADTTYDGYRRRSNATSLPHSEHPAAPAASRSPRHLYEGLFHPTDGSAISRPEDRLRGAPRHPRRA